eukprot:TRINITY_DN1923_c0_g2_i4.p1 TRINITY_DN1923_c0_g2~~TRINITY_DN1923_c0_g2_i4.p1  ORF type:complete len:445 (+),score=80.93 TRINITY_DN1923_c0_g2_i4:78-1412(+)
MRALLLLTLLAFCVLSQPSTKFEVKTFQTPQQVYTGFLTVDTKTENPKQLFYQLHSRLQGTTQTPAPIIIWLQGGPGESSLVANYLGVGPLRLLYDAESLKIKLIDNPFTLNNEAHLLFIDQPLGTGYSNEAPPFFGVPDTETAALHLYRFLNQFFSAGLFPELTGNDVYLMGEDYAGHILPVLAKMILDDAEVNHIPLKGIVLGNPLIEAETEWRFYDRAAYAMGLITDNQRANISQMQSNLVQNLRSGKDGLRTLLEFAAVEQWIPDWAGGFKFNSSWREYGTNQFENDLGWLERWLNAPENKFNTGVPDIYNWTAINMRVAFSMGSDVVRSFKDVLDEVASKGLDVLVFNGQDNLKSNVPGVLSTINSLQTVGQNFKSTEKRQLLIAGQPGGWLKGLGKFHYAVVYKAGARSLYDQGLVSHELLSRYLNGKLDIQPNQQGR